MYTLHKKKKKKYRNIVNIFIKRDTVSIVSEKNANRKSTEIRYR